MADGKRSSKKATVRLLILLHLSPVFGIVYWLYKALCPQEIQVEMHSVKFILSFSRLILNKLVGHLVSQKASMLILHSSVILLPNQSLTTLRECIARILLYAKLVKQQVGRSHGQPAFQIDSKLSI